ncbi:hypothetical protein LCGC14_1080320, partial [marine sediment metagenome]
CTVDRLCELLDLQNRGKEMPADKVPA